MHSFSYIVFFFLILQPISVFWSQSIIAEHVLYDTKSPDVHAEPSEAMPLQQGGHWVGKTGVTTFCRKGVYYDAHRWVPNFEHSELSEVMMQRQMSSGCVYTHPLWGQQILYRIYIYFPQGYTIFISAWASELLIFLRRQVRRPGARDKQQSTDLTLLFVYTKVSE